MNIKGAEHVSANTSPYQLYWSDQEMGTAISCTECSKVADLIQKANRSFSCGYFSLPIVPTLTVDASITSPTGPFTAGQSYTLTCRANVTGGETLSPTTTITWIHPSGSVTSGTGSSLDLSLNQLRVSDAGQYTCNVSVSSPFFTRAQSDTDTFTITVQSKLISNKVG